jgi:hypothetical protein
VIAWITASVSMPSGSGSCTRIPCTSERAFSSATRATSAVVVVSAGSRRAMEAIPISVQARSFDPT